MQSNAIHFSVCPAHVPNRFACAVLEQLLALWAGSVNDAGFGGSGGGGPGTPTGTAGGGPPNNPIPIGGGGMEAAAPPPPPPPPNDASGPEHLYNPVCPLHTVYETNVIFVPLIKKRVRKG